MDKKNNNKKDMSTEKCIMIVGFVLGSFLLDVSVVLGIVVILAGFLLPGILKAKEKGVKFGSGDLGETVKTVMDETKQAWKEELNSKDAEDDEVPLPKQVESAGGSDDLDDGEVFDDPDKGGFLKRVTEQKKAEEQEACEADHIHAEQYRALSDDEKRREQLKGMLDAGLIDKKEYSLMLKKYGLK